MPPGDNGKRRGNSVAATELIKSPGDSAPANGGGSSNWASDVDSECPMRMAYGNGAVHVDGCGGDFVVDGDNGDGDRDGSS